MKSKYTTGSTLTEVVVALFLLTLFMGGAYRLVTQALWANQQARDHYVAVNLANSRLERARNIQYADFGLLAENQVVMTENGTPNTAGSFRRTTTVTAPSSNLTELVITVDIINRRTRSFSGGASETVASMLVK